MALLVRSMSNALMPLHAIFSGKWHLTLVTTELCYSVVHSSNMPSAVAFMGKVDLAVWAFIP
jgi:hypothetical protein